jgi:hypothetical protein
MVVRRRCASLNADGEACQMAPLRDRPFCFAHDPERAEDAAEARRLGGVRRKKERTIAIAFDLPGLDTPEGIRRVFEIARTDLLGLDNSIGRARALIAAGTAAIKLLMLADYEERLATLEAVVLRRNQHDAAEE